MQKLKRTPRRSVDIFTTPPDEIRWSDVKSFLDGQFPEDARIDYKADMTDRITESIAAMGNTRGGVILVGVGEDPTKKTPLLPPPGISIQHQGGGTLVTHCQRRLQPVYVPPYAYVGIPTQRDRAILIVQVRPDEAPIPLWDEIEGVLVRIGDQNRPADLPALRTLLVRDDERVRPLYALADQLIGSMLQISGENNPTTIVVGGIIRRSPGVGEWSSSDRRRLTKLILSSIKNHQSLNVDARAQSIVLSREEHPPIYISFSEAGVIAARIGWMKNPFPFAALLVGLRFGLGLVLSDVVAETYQPILPLEIEVGFVNWPDKGLKTEPLFRPPTLEVGRHPRTHHRVSKTFHAPAGSSLEPIIMRFVDMVLADAGYVDYEHILSQLHGLAVGMVMNAEDLAMP